MAVRTSESDPIRVDFLPDNAGLGPARLGMTFAPGKKASGIAGQWQRDLDTDLARLVDEYGVRVLVSLLTPHEYVEFGIADLPTAARKGQLEFLSLPIEDGGIPHSVSEAVVIVKQILERLQSTGTVVVHCRGGLGRTGLIAACCLTTAGHEAEQAIAAVRAARTNAIENSRQEVFIAEFAAEWQRTKLLSDDAARKRDRIHGCLLGGALGDALGYPVEFMRSWTRIAELYGRDAPERLAYAGRAPAAITDDTQMALFVAEGFIRAVQRFSDRGICNPVFVIRSALLRWYATQVPGAKLSKWQGSGWLSRDPRLHHQRAPGNTNLTALAVQLDRQLAAGSELGPELPSIGARPNNSKGCGAVMRSAPIGLGCFSAAVSFGMARDAAVVTHGHPSGYLSAAYFAAVIHEVANGATLPVAMDTADTLLAGQDGCGETVDAIARARELAATGAPTPDAVEFLGGGWVGEEALAIALACALTASGPMPNATATALWRAVVHGGDSDSTASLTGNLLGAMHGTACLPSHWLEELELRDVIERIAEDLFTSAILGRELDHDAYPPV